jgi:hypothetical protein
VSLYALLAAAANGGKRCALTSIWRRRADPSTKFERCWRRRSTPTWRTPARKPSRRALVFSRGASRSMFVCFGLGGSLRPRFTVEVRMANPPSGCLSIVTSEVHFPRVPRDYRQSHGTRLFITTGGDDLIVAFAVMDPTDPFQIENLMLLWTPNPHGEECGRSPRASSFETAGLPASSGSGRRLLISPSW